MVLSRHVAGLRVPPRRKAKVLALAGLRVPPRRRATVWVKKVGGGLGGSPTLLDVCSFLGMGRAREGESGEEEEGGWSWVVR